MDVRMQDSSCSSASSNSMGTCSEIEVKNHHNIDSKLRISKNGSNCRKKFYKCSLLPISGKFFVFCLTRIISVKLNCRFGCFNCNFFGRLELGNPVLIGFQFSFCPDIFFRFQLN